MASFRDLYDSPPPVTFQVGAEGSATTSQMYPAHPPAAHEIPRHIVEDSTICAVMGQAAETYLSNIGHAVPYSLEITHQQLPGRPILQFVGNEGVNSGFFLIIAEYCISFVVAADQIQTHELRFFPPGTVGGVQPDYIFSRQDITRITVETKGIAAYTAHRDQITSLSRANNGNGSELVYQEPETGGRSIVFKVKLCVVHRMKTTRC